MDALGTFENPRPYDIMCGRNRNSFNNIGNRRFRITINMNVEKYNALRSRHERSKFIANLAHTMRYEVGFRFLKKKSGKNSETVDLTDEEVRAKIGHALRDLSTVLRENAAEEGSPDSRVPRPGPYKKQDKDLELQAVSSSDSVETLRAANTSSLQHKYAKPQARMGTPSPAPVSSSSQDIINTTSMMTAIKEQQEASSPNPAAPDQVRSASPTAVPQAGEATPLHSNQVKSIKKIFGNHQENLELFHLEVGEACQSLLSPPPETLLPPPLDDDYDDLDEYWTHSELQNERSGRSHRTAMSIATLDMQNERSGRSQRTSMSVGTFDMSIGSSCCLSDAIETLSLVST
eukprot:CAMPEP_0113631676 /NCGR_PEP_ID=MMETSP0017_2-20120614/16461_1 /TAXON_ID=2856 /ORGANISM="Cylindrotheca closterium" /LENGTH=346 /DNA_ID=CAMNT_0000542195 /DNA_START=62 /DNA_END=1102 /DNA_ORIENTATION=+ /assembly_acc=CAM_ASM_000147